MGNVPPGIDDEVQVLKRKCAPTRAVVTDDVRTVKRRRMCIESCIRENPEKRQIYVEWSATHITDVIGMRDTIEKNQGMQMKKIGRGSFGVVFRCGNFVFKALRYSEYATQEVLAMLAVNRKRLATTTTMIGYFRINKTDHETMFRCPIQKESVDDYIFVIMFNYIKSTTLHHLTQDYLCGNYRICLERIMVYFITCAKTVRALHECNTFHSDIKSDNLLIRPDDSLVLCDFGLSTTYNEDKNSVLRAGADLRVPDYLPINSDQQDIPSERETIDFISRDVRDFLDDDAQAIRVKNMLSAGDVYQMAAWLNMTLLRFATGEFVDFSNRKSPMKYVTVKMMSKNPASLLDIPKKCKSNTLFKLCWLLRRATHVEYQFRPSAQEFHEELCALLREMFI